MCHEQKSIAINSGRALMSSSVPGNGIPAREGAERVGRYKPPAAHASLRRDTLLAMSMESLVASLRPCQRDHLDMDKCGGGEGGEVTKDTFSFFCPKYHVRWKRARSQVQRSS